MRYLKPGFVWGSAVSVAMMPIAAQAVEANQLTNINGIYADDAERDLRSRGFSHESSHDSYSNGYTYSYWWHRDDDDCVRVEAYRGEVVTVADAEDGDCGHPGGGAAAAIGIAAGAAILGAILSSKSHHRQNDQDDSGDNRQEFDRGYNDGLYNHSYHNNHQSDSYSRGYTAGVDEREGQSNGRTHRGGYTNAAQFSDLQGARASAIDQLSDRGFTQVDNFTSGDTRYGIWWRASSRQCLQATIADGRVYDFRDIQTHPRCR